MENKWEKEIEVCFEEFNIFWKSESYYIAISNLGEIYLAIPFLSQGLQKKWMHNLCNVNISIDIIEKVKCNVENTLEHILRLFSIPNTLIYENCIFILTKRIEIENIKRFINDVNFQAFNVDLNEIDNKIAKLIKNKKIQNEFTSAIKSIRKNLRLPTSVKWIG